MFIQKRKITAAEDVDIEVAPEATDILFEAEDVAELLAEVTEQVVEVNVDGEDVIFNVGEDEFVVTPDGDEEIVETSRKVLKKAVEAAKAPDPKEAVKANTEVKKVVRKVSK